MLSADQIQLWLAQALPDSHISVTGDDGAHFETTVVSPEFIGKSLVQRHQVIYRALGDHMQEIHALSIQAHTPDESPITK